jgi:hypothetical protein
VTATLTVGGTSVGCHLKQAEDASYLVMELLHGDPVSAFLRLHGLPMHAPIALPLPALCASVKPLTPELRADPEQMLARTIHSVARVQLDVQPIATTALVDCVALAITPESPLVLHVGEHVVELGAKGFRSDRRHPSINGGDASTLTALVAPERRAGRRARQRHAVLAQETLRLWGSVGVLAARTRSVGVGYALGRPDPASSPAGLTARHRAEGVVT